MKGKDTLRVGAPYRLSQNKTTTINTRRQEQKQFIKNRQLDNTAHFLIVL